MNERSQALFDSIRDLAPAISKRSEEIESARRIPPDLLGQLKSAGCFRMFTPDSHGGLEVDFPASMEMIEALAHADGSTGWVVMIGCETPMLLALMPRKRFDETYAHSPDVIIAGGFAPRGEADRTANGYRVRGRWGFASGCEHADWLFGNCIVTERGKPRISAVTGGPEIRGMMVPAHRARIIDTWSVAGLRGTGSHDVAIEDVVVPAHDTVDIFAGRPSIAGAGLAELLLYAALHIGAVGVGIAQRALDEIVAIGATNKTRLYAQTAMADNALFQYRLGDAAANIRAARMILMAEAEFVWKSALENVSPGAADRARIMSEIAWSARAMAATVDASYTAGGGTSPYNSSPLQRCMRDIHTLTQHAAVAESWISGAGAAMVGRGTAFGVR
jgi:alkylation response protein AidB-like acyl-CoA dehydrogenase